MTADALHALLPPETLRRHRLRPLGGEGAVARVGTDRPPPPALLQELAFLVGRPIEPVALPAEVVDAFLAEHAPPEPEPVPAHGAPPAAVPQAAPRATLVRGPVVQQVDGLLAEAIRRRASDVHVEPYDGVVRVRYRLDGVLHTAHELAPAQKDAVVSRLKIMAGLDIAEKRRPQDGRVRFRHGARTVDLRVSTLPTGFGEKVVLRVLDKTHLRLELEALGLQGDALAAVRAAIHRPYGMVLVTGPTGSGKTTTLYAALAEINTDAVNVTTVEDPVEYDLPGINQTHVRADIGFGFAEALRAFLRQDPDVIMVGEVRDAETAAIAVRAALTGHLVLSTIHTNDAPTTVSRLADMGVEPYLVASSLRLVVAQRLVRRVCDACKAEAAAGAVLAAELGLRPGEAVYRGGGCPACGGTGYRGRLALYEVLPVDEALADLVARRAGTQELRRHARARGLCTLREAALARVRAGDTTPEEALRETAL